MRQAPKAVAMASAVAVQVVDGLQERFVAMLPPAASEACRPARRGK